MPQLARRVQALHESSQDMTEEERKRLWTSILEQCEEGVLVCDAEQRILVVNAAFEKITGFSAREVIGQTPRILHSGRQDRDFYADMWQTIEKKGRWSGELWNRRKNGDIYVQWLNTKAVCNKQGGTTHYLGIFSDITERKAAQVRARHLEEHDPLTELPNRTAFLRRLQTAIGSAKNCGEKLAVLLIDLDRFNDINDSMGHEAGDLLLQTMTSRISSVVRHSDMVARMGADEFAVFLPGLLGGDDAAVIAQKALDAIRVPILLHEQEVVVSASIGICISPEDGVEPEQLLRNAGAAMQYAKREHRDAYQFYTRQMNERAAVKLRLENELRLALHRQELLLHYQPQIDLKSGTIIGVEALVRWNHPELGLLAPQRFMSLAEQSGLIHPIGKWVVGEAIRQIRAWDAMGLPPITIAVNVSAGEFHQPGFVEDLAREIHRHAIDPKRLELELTESIAIKDIHATAKILDRLHDLGVRLSLDDFGTGYSSLNYLSRFHMDRLKIDRSFTCEMTQKPEAVQVVRAIIALAKSFNMKVIAEGVETPVQLQMLENEDCDEIQGYLAGKPMPPQELCQFIRDWTPLANATQMASSTTSR